MTAKRVIASLLACVMMFSSFAETASTETAAPYIAEEFADWQRDLRRAEIISFGSLPFVSFMTTFVYDTFRYVSRLSSGTSTTGYEPWPFKNASTAVALTEDEQKGILWASIGVAVGVAAFDFGFRAVKRFIRDTQAEKNNQVHDDDPIIVVPIVKDLPLAPEQPVADETTQAKPEQLVTQ